MNIRTPFRPIASGLVLTIAMVFSPAVPVIADQEAAREAGGAGPVWEVRPAEGHGVLYLAGSIHLLRDEDHPLPPAFDAAYGASEVLLMEVSPEEAAGAQALSLRRGTYPDGESIRDDLSGAAYRKLQRYLEASGLPADSMDGARPWMASMMISLTEMIQLGARPELGVDTHFEMKATADGRTIKGLETGAFQIGLFADLGDEEAEAMLLMTLEEMGRIEEEFAAMVDAWRDGDAEALRELVHGSMTEIPELHKAMFDDRNARWIETFAEGLEAGEKVMAIVGAGHLVGDAGVVALLRERGYSVQPFHGATAGAGGRFIRL